jgi:hypothetical protein
MKSRKMITRILTITTLAVVMALAMIMPIAHAIMWVGPGGNVGKPTSPSHGGAPIYTPQVASIGYGGGSGSGVSTFSPPQGNTGSGYGRFPHAVPMMRTPPPTNGLSDGSVGNGVIAQGNPGSGQGSVTVIDTNNNGQLTVTKVNENGNGYTVTTTTYNSNGQPVSQTTTTVSKGQTFTTTNTYTTQTITKTYTQYIYDIYVMDHYIYYYMYPIIKWVFTLVNIGQYQAPGYHSIGNEKLFTPGFGGGSGIFVPVFAQEAIYIFNIAPTTKPQITGWYTGSTSQSTSGPYLVSQSSTPPQLTGIQDTVNTIQQLATITIPNITKYTTNWVYSTSVFNNKTTVFILPTPYYYNNPNQNFALALQNLLQGNIAGAAYYTGKGIYENLWNAGAWAVQQAFYFVSQASNAFNTATLVKAVAASIYGGVEGVGNALGQLFTKSWWSWP